MKYISIAAIIIGTVGLSLFLFFWYMSEDELWEHSPLDILQQLNPYDDMGKRQQRTVGAIVKVPLDEKWHTYARILDDAVYAFYDAKTDKEMEIKDIVASPILFKVAVMDYAVTSGRWEKIGKLPLDDSLKKLPCYFIQDPLNPNHFEIYDSDSKIRSATREEVEGLERAAVWDPEHVEDRLRDHYAGVPNKWVESLKIRE